MANTESFKEIIQEKLKHMTTEEKQKFLKNLIDWLTSEYKSSLSSTKDEEISDNQYTIDY